MYQQIIFFFVFTNLNPLGVVGYHVCNNLDFMRNFVIIFTSGCYMKDEVIFMLNLVFALISRRNYGTIFAMYALKVQIFASSNFCRNLFLREFIFAILAKFAKFAKKSSHKIYQNLKIRENFP